MNSGKRSILLFETIRVLQFEPENLDFHIRRANASTTNGLRFDMASVVSVPGEGLYRVKIEELLGTSAKYAGMDAFYNLKEKAAK